MFRLKHSLLILIIFALTVQATTININELSLWAGGTIGLGSYVNVGGTMASAGNISTGSGTSLASIYTQGNVWLGSNSYVSGNVLANGQVQTGYNVSIGGSSDDYGDFVLPQLDLLESGGIGTDNIYGAKNSTTTLSSGLYRDLSFDKNTTLNLSAGSYSLNNFWMNKNSVVNIDTSGGDVILNVSGGFSTGRDVSFTKSGSGNLYINVFGANVWLDNDVTLNAIVKVFGGNLGFGDSAQLAGQYYATGDIWLGSNSQIEYVSSQAIPEPASLAIFALSGFCLMVQKKRFPAVFRN